MKRIETDILNVARNAEKSNYDIRINIKRKPMFVQT